MRNPYCGVNVGLRFVHPGKVAGRRKELAREERELTKLQQAKKVLEAQ